MTARRRTALILGALLLAVLAAAGWLAYTGVRAKRELTAARAAVQAVRADVLDTHLTAATAALRRAQVQAHLAREHTGGPVWAFAAHIPWLGAPVASARGVAVAADQLATGVLPGIIATAHALDPHTLRVGPHQLNLRPLAGAATRLSAVSRRVDAVRSAVAALPHATWLGQVDAARASLDRQVRSLAGTLDDAALAARLLPPMLGADGPRHYLVVFQNDAEARGTGGLPGAYALLTADHGTLTFSGFANDTAMGGVRVPVPFGAAYEAAYGSAQPGAVFVNSDISPHFPYAARLWLAYWQAKTGQRLDGAMATDPTALSYLLGASGPTALADGTVVSAHSVVALTESVAYARYSDVAARKQFFLQVARAAAQKIFHAAGASTALLHALGRAAGEHRLLVYSAHPVEERLISPTPLSGVVPDTAAPYSAFVINNGAGTKLDYYLTRTIRWRAGSCAGPTRRSQVTVTLTNTAPPGGLPGYVAVRHDQNAAGAPPDSEVLLTSLYATRGATLLGVTDNGRPATFLQLSERGHPVYAVTVDLNAGQRQTLRYELTEPTSRGAPVLAVQPGVQPVTASAQVPTCP